MAPIPPFHADESGHDAEVADYSDKYKQRTNACIQVVVCLLKHKG